MTADRPREAILMQQRSPREAKLRHAAHHNISEVARSQWRIGERTWQRGNELPPSRVPSELAAGRSSGSANFRRLMPSLRR